MPAEIGILGRRLGNAFGSRNQNRIFAGVAFNMRKMWMRLSSALTRPSVAFARMGAGLMMNATIVTE
jgi:hypothetical protein